VTLGPVLELDGQRLVRDLPPDKARKIIQEIGTMHPALANLTKSVLRRLFSFAITLRWRRDNPFEAITSYKIGTHHTWTDAELAAYEKRWPLGTRARLAYDILLYTAQRVGDAVRIQRSDIRNGIITLVQEKTGAEVFIPLHPALARSIKAGPATGLFLIGDRVGRPITARRLSELISDAAKAAGLPGLCVAHGLRKAALRRLAEHRATSKETATARESTGSLKIALGNGGLIDDDTNFRVKRWLMSTHESVGNPAGRLIRGNGNRLMPLLFSRSRTCAYCCIPVWSRRDTNPYRKKYLLYNRPYLPGGTTGHERGVLPDRMRPKIKDGRPRDLNSLTRWASTFPDLRRKNSLLSAKNSLFHCVGNSAASL
jgi:Phage integrase family